MPKKFTRAELSALKKAVRENVTMSSVLRDLQMRVNGGNFTTLKRRIKAHNINNEHWLGYGHLKGRQAYNKGQGPPLEEVMVKDSSYSRSSLKRRLVDEGVLKNRCPCGQETRWKKQTLVLVLDNTNGLKNDHRLENLRLLCPNCNSQTATFAGRNVKH